jgi:hypothetical protein
MAVLHQAVSISTSNQANDEVLSPVQQGRSRKPIGTSLHSQVHPI